MQFCEFGRRSIGERKGLIGALMLVAALLLASCASRPEIRDPRVFDRDVAAEFFSAAFEGIYAFHIDPPDIPHLALKGMNAISELDGDFKVQLTEGRLRVTMADSILGEFKAPERNDIPRWSMLTTAAIDLARGSSKAVRNADPETLYRLIVQTAVSELDRFSRYAGAEAARRNRAQRQGYTGIGVTLRQAGQRIVLSAVFENSPASDAGVRTGDVLSEVDGQPIHGLAIVDVSQLIRGSEGETVSIGVIRDKRLKHFSIQRARVIEQTVFYRRHGNVARFLVTAFNVHTASAMRDKISQATRDIGKSIKGLIVDLRGNRGGIFKDAVAISDLLITEGDILTTKGRHPKAVNHFEAQADDVSDGLPVVVLIDKSSASASEIVAAALQDASRAVLIGGRTYGKGSVQTIVSLPNGGELYVTWTKMYTPTGYPISRFGVYPVICTNELTGGAAAVIEALEAETMAPPTHLVLRHDANYLTHTQQEALLRSCATRAIREESGDGNGDLDLKLAQNLLSRPELHTRLLAISKSARIGRSSQTSSSKPPTPSRASSLDLMGANGIFRKIQSLANEDRTWQSRPPS